MGTLYAESAERCTLHKSQRCIVTSQWNEQYTQKVRNFTVPVSTAMLDGVTEKNKVTLEKTRRTVQRRKLRRSMKTGHWKKNYPMSRQTVLRKEEKI